MSPNKTRPLSKRTDRLIQIVGWALFAVVTALIFMFYQPPAL